MLLQLHMTPTNTMFVDKTGRHSDAENMPAVPYWPIAQLVERRTVNSNVPGSRPGGPAQEQSPSWLRPRTHNSAIVGSSPTCSTEHGWLVVRKWLISSLELRSIRKCSTKAPSSIGQDLRLSSWGIGFNSLWSYKSYGVGGSIDYIQRVCTSSYVGTDAGSSPVTIRQRLISSTVCKYSVMVARHPSKLKVRVRVPLFAQCSD